MDKINKKLWITVFFCFSFFAVGVTAAQKRNVDKFNDEERKTMQIFLDKGDFAGLVTIVADKNKILSFNCMGYRDLSKKLKMEKNTLFWIASQSKPIAATAVMMLVEEGKLSLDEPITTYLPELKDLKVDQEYLKDSQKEYSGTPAITLRRLLSHTSGMKWVGSIQEKVGKIDIIPLNSSVYVSAQTSLCAVPGDKFSYSNQGVNTAAAIIERISGMPYEKFLEQRIFKPLGMKNTTFWPDAKQQKNMAISYEKVNGSLREARIDQLQYPLNDKHKRYPEAAGGLFSTPEDLVKFYRMIANGGIYKGKRFLSASSVAEMGKKQTGKNVETSYGLGWAVSEDEMSHGGSYGTDTRVNKKSGLVTLYFVQERDLDEENGKAQNSFVNEVKAFFNVSK